MCNITYLLVIVSYGDGDGEQKRNTPYPHI